MRLYTKNHKKGCKCKGRQRVLAEICGCINPKCNFDSWICIICNTTRRYKSWIILHCNKEHNLT